MTKLDDLAAEEHAAHHAAALFDVSDRCQIKVTGTDRVKFLHGFCTNDIKQLQPGQGCEAFVTNVKGKVVAHVFVFATEQALWIDTWPGAAEKLLPHLERYIITEDVQLADRSAELGELFLAGPRAGEALRAIGVETEAMAECDSRGVEIDGGRASVRRTDWFGSPGFGVEAKRPMMPAIWERLVEHALPASAETFETCRIAAGLPRFGVDITDEHLAQEVGRTARAISFRKGCYLGQEPIARIDALGHVNRILCRLEVPGERATPDLPSPLFAEESLATQIGLLTSGAYSHERQAVVAIGLVRTSIAKSAQPRVHLRLGDRNTAATVIPPAE